ncbi:MAG: UDP-N-acetylmuramoyl-L-alanyl-D-glutamate--2,6-diaminopimelate ligase [Solirubrobacteraceae bacterium]
MRLEEVFAAGGGVVSGARGKAGAVEITGLAYDSRMVAPGSLFFCVTGFQHDGHEFAKEALANGAAALVVERPLGLGAPEVLVAGARAAMGPAAVRFYGDPSAALRVVGVTGTNVKTTTAFLLKALLEAGEPGSGCGLLGTVKSVIGGEEREAGRTTPEAIDLQADFRAMLDGGDRACAIEVSSHALSLGRAEGIHFVAAIFTNLTQDHLDFHEDMEDYFQAKRRLFATGPGVSVVNVGDPYGRRLAGELEGAVTFAVEPEEVESEGKGEGEGEGVEDPVATGADYRASDLRCDFQGCRFTLRTPAGEREVALPLPGRFNVANALGALAAVDVLGGDLDRLIEALERGVSVPGRMQPVDEGQDFAVLVDYAHTPDSLENVMRAARELTMAGTREPAGGSEAHGGGRVVCVFGAGGDRDRGKRPLMGEIAGRLADIAIVTSDNPRSEAPEAIIEEILTGAQGAVQPRGASPIASIADRRAAIFRAIEVAAPGDIVVIAGKGHEQGQEFAGGQKLPFDDVTVAREGLRARIEGERARGGTARLEGERARGGTSEAGTTAAGRSSAGAATGRGG